MRTHKTVSFAVALVLVFSVFMILSGAVFASTGAPTVVLSADAASFDADQPVVVHVTIANPTKHLLKVLKWHTPSEGVEGPLFKIQRDYGISVGYTGPLFKRPKPTHEDYVSLKPGESITYDVDIASCYDLSVTGYYSIIYDVSSWDLYSENDKGKKDAEHLTSNEIKVWITGRAAAVSQDIEPPAKASGTTSFNKCTISQQTVLGAARAQAGVYSANTLAYLRHLNYGSTRYTTWFGIFDYSRLDTVTTHFSSISSAMDNANVMFDCSCKKKYYAYVYPTRPYTIYLCKVFWTAPPTGTDSQAGTLIHEMSHFKTVASTDDWVYGQSAAMSLAITDPGKAITNADNHEYCAENNPELQ